MKKNQSGTNVKNRLGDKVIPVKERLGEKIEFKTLVMLRRKVIQRIKGKEKLTL